MCHAPGATLGVIAGLASGVLTLYSYAQIGMMSRPLVLVYAIASVTYLRGSFAFPAIIFIFFTRPDVKQAMTR